MSLLVGLRNLSSQVLLLILGNKAAVIGKFQSCKDLCVFTAVSSCSAIQESKESLICFSWYSRETFLEGQILPSIWFSPAWNVCSLSAHSLPAFKNSLWLFCYWLALSFILNTFFFKMFERIDNEELCFSCDVLVGVIDHGILNQNFHSYLNFFFHPCHPLLILSLPC